MRWATFIDKGRQERVGLLCDEKLHALPAGSALIDLLGDDGERLARAGERAQNDADAVFALEEVQLLPPIPRPPSIRDFYAFEQHARAGRKSRGQELPEEWFRLPVFYFTNPHALIGQGAAVEVPAGTQCLDFELEVAAVIGRHCTHITPEQAAEYIVGFTILNDWSARDLQREEMVVGLGPAKGKDFATSLGPWLVTPDEIAPRRKGAAYDLEMRAFVNGVQYSAGNLADIYWSFEEMISYASRSARIVAGDIIGSGTCATGCIVELSQTHSPERFPWLKVGDHVSLTVEALGALDNHIVPGKPPMALRGG
jgi:2-keto-4-pentenoate hydratase/2-oxohepta-3-ene-1,7-dioic acid hydratase in catechol pathway